MPITEYVRDSDRLVIAITGFAHKLNMPVDMFFEKSGLDDVSRIVIYDPSRLATLGGLPPEYPTFMDFVNHLRKVISAHPHEQLICTGTSGGAYAALLLGHLLKADYAVAFSPYTYLSEEVGKKLGDPAVITMKRAINRFNKLPDKVKIFLDLGTVLSEWNRVTEYYIHVSRYNTWDYKRAMYLHQAPHVNIITHPYEYHAVASMIAKEENLANCFIFPYRKETAPYTQIWNINVDINNIR